MKKFVVLALMLISSICAFSQDFIETVYLKNGSVIKGDVVEFQPRKLIKVESADGNYFVVDYYDIEKITRERVWNETRQNENVRDYGGQYDVPQLPINTGFRGFVGLDFLMGEFFGFEFTTTLGAQLNHRFFLGGGFGMILAGNWEDDHYSFPVYADFRFDFVDKKISPFLDLRAGSDFAVHGDSGFYGDCSFGCRFKRSYVSLGVQTMRSHYYSYQENIHYYVNPVTGISEVRKRGEEVRTECPAFDFVVRFSFGF